MKCFHLFLFFLIPALIYGQSKKTQVHGHINKWKLTWSDEFNFKGHPDPKKWAYEEGYFRRRSEVQYYTVNRLKNARVDGQHLILEAHKETPESFYPTSKNDKWHRYTSASVNTRNSKSWKYGLFEIKAKLPKGKGTWPAIWFLSPIRTPWVYNEPWEISEPHNGPGGDGPGGGESSQGEIDLMESWGSRPNKTYVYIHGTAGPKPSASYEHEDTYNEFNTYAMEWYSDHMDFFRNDEKILTYNKDQSAGWAFNKRMYLLMNVALGGDTEPAPDPGILPQSMIVDYVRVYKQVK